MKKLFTILSMLCVAAVMSAATTNYDLWFDGIQVTSSNANKIHGSSFITYDASTKTLTLDNIGFSGKTAEVIKSDIEGLTIRVIGTVNLSSTAADKCTFLLNGKTRILGSGTTKSILNVTRNDATGGVGYQPIRANCDIEIKDITMKVSNANGGTAIRPFRTPDDETNPSAYTLSVTNANVTFAAGGTYYPIYGFKYVKLTGCSLNPMTFYKNDAKSYYVADNVAKGVTGKDIVIKNRKYGTIGDYYIIDDAHATDIKPTGLNAGAISLHDFAYGSGKFIILNNVNFTNTSDVALGLRIDCDEPCHFEIVLNGENKITASLPLYISSKTVGDVWIKGVSSATMPSLNLYALSQTGIDVRCPSLIFKDINLYVSGKNGGITGSQGYSSGDYTLSFNNCRARIVDTATTTQGAINHFKSVSYSDCYYDGFVTESWEDNAYCTELGEKKDYVDINRGYGILLKGTDVTKDNKDDVFGDGKVSYNPSTKTLNLKNVNIQDDIEEAIETHIPLTINLSGDNTLATNGGRVTASFHANATIKGSAGTTLAINGTTKTGYSGIYLDQAELTIKDCEVSVNCPNGSAVYGRWSPLSKTVPGTSTLTLDNTSLVAKTSNLSRCIGGLKNMTLVDCYFANPAAATFDAANGEVKIGSSSVMGNLEIRKGYGLSVGGTVITKDNRADVFGNGGVKYDPSSNTLTLDNAIIACEGYAIDAQTKQRLYINLIGTSIVQSLRSYALYHNNTNGITIQSSSNGMLRLNGSSVGSFQEAGNLTIKNCEVVVNGMHGKEGGNYCTLNLDNVKLSSKCNYGAFKDIDNILLSNCYVIEPEGAVFNSTMGGYVLDGTLCNTVHINAGTSAIDGVTIDANDNAPAYDLRGVQVDKSYKGIVIKNGRKYIQK